MPTIPKCMTCRTKTSNKVLFTLENGHLVAKKRDGTAWVGKAATICKDCAETAMAKELAYGYLTTCQSRTYYNASMEGSFSDKFIQEGVVVIPANMFYRDLVFIQSINQWIRKKKLDERKNLNYLSDDIVNGKKSRNLNRMWCNIYGDPKSVLKKDKEGGELLGHVEQFALEIEKLLFPDLYWGRFMLHCCEIIRKGDVKKSPRCKGNVERSLRCNKINLLARFAGLNTTQHFHRDFEGLGLEAILVLRCNKSYSFAYFKGSHELSFNGGIEKETNVMKKDLVHLEVPVNHYIFFHQVWFMAGGLPVWFRIPMKIIERVNCLTCRYPLISLTLDARKELHREMDQLLLGNLNLATPLQIQTYLNLMANLPASLKQWLMQQQTS